ncbi:ABC transporter permease [Paenibacillus sp. 1A_MP2]|uniref:ABC transporter permease n=1 Tax=Paenibacillus sp. 1A_MP2 TaxID=3457495 RepID=UPI003FCC538D
MWILKKALAFLSRWILFLILASILVFTVTRTIPGSPAEQLLFAYQLAPTEENISRLNAKWGLDQPLIQQYWTWISNFVQGDWGKSIVSKTDIRAEFMARLPYSLIIGLGGLLSAATLSFFFGYRAALHPNGLFDRLTRFLALFSQAVPNFIISVFIIYYLGVYLDLIHFFGASSIPSVFCATVVSCIYSVGEYPGLLKHSFRSK